MKEEEEEKALNEDLKNMWKKGQELLLSYEIYTRRVEIKEKIKSNYEQNLLSKNWTQSSINNIFNPVQNSDLKARLTERFVKSMSST